MRRTFWRKAGYSLPLILLLYSACVGDDKPVVMEKHQNGTPRREVIYQNVSDSLIGKERLVYENGQTELEGQYDDSGRRTGSWKYYYPTGQLWSETGYDSGEKHGKTTVYYENGKMRYESFFEKGKPTGKWVFYDESGKVVEEEQY